MKSLEPFRRNVHSQNGEDGVIEHVLRKLGIQGGRCVEFGAWDGKHLSNTYNLVRNGWTAVYIEGDASRFGDLIRTCDENPGQITPIRAYVESAGANTLDAILARAEVRSIDLLSIDIDSYDWQVWESIRNYTPKVVLIEINSALRPGIRQIHQEHPSANGSSFTSTLELGLSKGYRLVLHTGNMIFVRSELIDSVGLSAAELQFPETLFDYSWIEASADANRLNPVRSCREWLRRFRKSREYARG